MRKWALKNVESGRVSANSMSQEDAEIMAEMMTRMGVETLAIPVEIVQMREVVTDTGEVEYEKEEEAS
jgi:hypothetical protein